MVSPGQFLHRLACQRLSSAPCVPSVSTRRTASRLSPSLRCTTRGPRIPCWTPVLRERLSQTRNSLGCEGRGPHTQQMQALSWQSVEPPLSQEILYMDIDPSKRPPKFKGGLVGGYGLWNVPPSTSQGLHRPWDQSGQLCTRSAYTFPSGYTGHVARGWGL